MTLLFTFRDGTTTTDTLEWARRYEDGEYRRVAMDEFGEWRVSTIWQGMPSMFGENRNYETAVFLNDNLVGETHHSTEVQAVAGHLEIVDTLKAGRRVDWLDI